MRCRFVANGHYEKIDSEQPLFWKKHSRPAPPNFDNAGETRRLRSAIPSLRGVPVPRLDLARA
jgi:hypothetical protein